MTERPPTRATARIARRKELRQSRIAEAQRRRANRTRLRLALAAAIGLLLGLLVWLGMALVFPPAAALVAMSPWAADATGWSLVGAFFGAFKLRMEPWLVS